MTNTRTNKPIYKERVGRLWVTVFENFNQDKQEVYFSIYVNRRFKNQDGQWLDAPYSLRDLEDDLPRACVAARRAILRHQGPQSVPQSADPSLLDSDDTPDVGKAA